MGKLSAISVRNAKPGRHADGEGLYLLVKPTGARSWLLRVQVDGKRRDVGLGSVDIAGRRDADESVTVLPILHRRHLTLGEAREKAGILLKVAKAGHDPVAERDRDRSVPTFEKAARECHTVMAKGWEEKHAAAFLSSLEEHVFKHIGSKRVDHVQAADIRDALAPIWTEKPVMARKVRQRISKVLDFSHSKGWRTTEAPKNSVTVGLSRQREGGNFAAMPFADVPYFVAAVRAKPATIGRLALLFLIATGARSGEVRSARLSDIDKDAKLWNRPAELMKSGRAHSVTLNQFALDLIKQAVPLQDGSLNDVLLFPSSSGKMLSDMTLTKILRDAGQPFTAHGFRSSFRDWAAEKMPTIPDPVAEAALAHAVPDKVVAAYKRTKFLEMRQQLLDGWGDYLLGQSNVIRLAAAG